MAEPRTRRKLFRRLLVLFAVSALLPILIMAGQGYHCARLAIIRATAQQMGALAAQAGSRVDEALKDLSAAVERIAQSPYIAADWLALIRGDSAARERVEGELRASLHGLAPLDGMAIIDERGRPIIAVGPGPHPLGNEEMALLEEARGASPRCVMGPVHPHGTSAMGIHIVCAIPAGGGVPRGFVLSNVDLADDIRPCLVAARASAHGARVELIGPSGEVFIASPADTGTESRRARVALPPPAGKATPYRSHGGTWVIGGRSEPQRGGWTVVAEIELGRALRALRPFVTVSSATAAVSCLLLLGLAWVFAGRVSAPIANVADTARRIAAGERGIRARYGRPDEVGALVGAFNAMVDGLLEAQAELSDKTRRLERTLEDLSAAQRRLIQSETLAAVGRIATSVVHEIRNPLSSIKMNVQLLARRLGEESPYDAHGRIALEGIRKLEAMLRELLELGRPIEPAFRPTDPTGVARRAIEAASPRAEAKGLRLLLEEEDGPLIRADPDRLERALLNLLINAVDASPRGGVVRIRVRGEDGGGAAFEILDRGVGIRPEHIEAIFDPFFTTKEMGTGLGLPIVRKIALLHGGGVRVENVPEGGVKATLQLPADAEAACRS